jgi:putative ABC transport system ATP-binding protein
MIRAENLQRHFPIAAGEPVRAVDGVSLRIDQGQFVAIMGPSGSGKSTLLYLLGAMDQPTGGTLRVADQGLEAMDDLARSRFRNACLGFVFQSFHLLARLSLRRNVELPLVYAGVPRSGRSARAEAVLRAVGLGDRLDRCPTEVSGGQSQRAAIARALVNRPRLLLADEPTGNLDSRTGLDVMAVFQALNHAGMTILMVTHDEAMAGHAGRILRMRDGRLVGDETVTAPRRAPVPADLDLASLLAGNEATPAATFQGGARS